MAYRCLHDDVPHSRTLGRLSDAGERLYMRILAVTDPWGRVTGDLDKLRLVAIPSLPWDDDKLHRAILELEQVGAIERYSTDGVWVIQVVNFDERQLVTKMKRAASRFPHRTPSSLSANDLTLSLPLLDTVEPGACDLGLSNTDLRASAEPEKPRRGPEPKFDYDEARRRLEAGEKASHLAREYGVSPSAIHHAMVDRSTTAARIVGLGAERRRGIMARDGNRCVYCGTATKLGIDHVIPRTLGGPEEDWNMVVSCEACNKRKGQKLTESAIALWEEHGGTRDELLTQMMTSDWRISTHKSPAPTASDRKTEDREDRRESGLPTEVARSPAQGLSVAQTIEQSLETGTPRLLAIALDPNRSADLGVDPGDLASFSSQLRGADDGLVHVLADLRRKGLPPAAFAAALESVRERRAAAGKPQLQSEVRYFVGALKTMLREGTYRHEGAAA
jgi:hypothetical protein